MKEEWGSFGSMHYQKNKKIKKYHHHDYEVSADQYERCDKPHKTTVYLKKKTKNIRNLGELCIYPV